MSDSTSKKSIYKRVGIISFFTLISRILGAARDMVLLHVFGAGVVHDAYVVAQTIPNALRRLTAEGSMTLAVVPIYTTVREKEGIEAARMFARRALGLVLFVTILVTLLGIIFSQQIVYLFASGYANNKEKFELTVFLTQWMFPYLIFVSIVAWAMGVLNAERRFAAPAAAPIFLNIGIIFGATVLALLIVPPILAVAIGMLIGGAMQILLQWPSLRKINQPFLPAGFFKDRAIRDLLILLAPSLIGVAVYEVNIIVLRKIASTFPDGQMTYYYTASRLTELVVGLFAFSFAAASFPELSKHSVHEKWQQVFDTLRFAVSGAMFIIIPATMGLILIAKPLIAMLYLHGEYRMSDVDMTRNVLMAFALSIPALAMIRLLLPVYYSLKDSKTPVFVAFISVLTTGFSGYWLGLSYKVVGLGFGLTIGTYVQALLLYVLLRTKGKIKGQFIPWLDILRYFLVAGLTTGLAALMCSWGHWNKGPFEWFNWLIFVSAIVLAAFFYFLIMIVIKDPHMSRVVRLIRR